MYKFINSLFISDITAFCGRNAKETEPPPKKVHNNYYILQELFLNNDLQTIVFPLAILGRERAFYLSYFF